MVANQKPVPVIVYDYYDSSRRARTFYQPLKATICDICDDAECKKKCAEKKSVSGNQRASPTVSEDVVQQPPKTPPSSSAATASSVTSILLYIIFHNIFLKP